MSMAKKRQRHGCASDVDGETSERPIPLDVLLEILARSDVKTVVRCAATSKAVRRVVLGPDFRGRLALRAEAHGGFDPALLLGVSYLLGKHISAADHRVVQSSRQHLRFDASLLRSHDPMASRDGLVVLQQRQTGPRSHEAAGVPPRAPPELHVRDSLTGETYRLPPAAIRPDYPHALLSAGARHAAGRSFQLLAVDRDLRTQTFSSTDGRWGPVSQTRYASQIPYLAPVDGYKDYTSRPIVLGSSSTVVQWLRLRLHRTPGSAERRYRDDPHIVALDVRSAQATRINLPPECISRMRCIQDTRSGLLLAASPDGNRPVVLTAEILVISMWTLSETEDSTWIRQVLIKRQVIGMETGFGGYLRFFGFGQRSGTVLLQMDAVGLIQLNLGSKEVLILTHECKENPNFRCRQLCLHEINLSSLLGAMRPL